MCCMVRTVSYRSKGWLVHNSATMQEYQDNQPNLSISNTNAKQTVYVFKCTKSTLKVSGKVNSIILGEPLKSHH